GQEEKDRQERREGQKRKQGIREQRRGHRNSLNTTEVSCPSLVIESEFQTEPGQCFLAAKLCRHVSLPLRSRTKYKCGSPSTFLLSASDSRAGSNENSGCPHSQDRHGKGPT